MEETGINGQVTTGCNPLSETLLKNSAELLGSPFVTNTDENLNDGYPVFEWQIPPYQFKGSGTESDPYQISSKEELEIMRDLVNSNYFPSYCQAWYIQTADIDLENELWEPIGTRDNTGTDLSAPLFWGNYNGNYHKIINLYVNKEYNYAGLFGSLRGNKAIENLLVYGNVNGAFRAVGGICGEIVNGGGSVRNCAFIGNVNGNGHAVGGIAGVIYQNGTIENCYHIGTVTNSGVRTGGLVGWIDVGRLSGTAILKNSYHVGSVSGQTNETSGAIAGLMVNNGETDGEIHILNCYYLKGDAPSGTNGEADKCDTMMLTSSLLKLIAEDLGTAFVKSPDNILNDGYPVFTWQISVTGDVNEDGNITVSDVIMLQKYLHGKIKFTEQQFHISDVTSDGIVNIFDLIYLKRMLLKKGILQ